SLSNGPTTRIGTRNTRPATNSAATTVRASRAGAARSASIAAGAVAPSATEPNADSRCRRPHRRGDPLLVAGGGEPIRRPVDVDGRHDLGARVGDGRGHRADAFGPLVASPGVAVAPDIAQPLEQRAGVGQGPRRELLQ